MEWNERNGREWSVEWNGMKGKNDCMNEKNNEWNGTERNGRHQTRAAQS